MSEFQTDADEFNCFGIGTNLYLFTRVFITIKSKTLAIRLFLCCHNNTDNMAQFFSIIMPTLNDTVSFSQLFSTFCIDNSAKRTNKQTIQTKNQYATDQQSSY